MSIWRNPSKQNAENLISLLVEEKRKIIHNDDFIGIDTMKILIENGNISDVKSVIGSSMSDEKNVWMPWCGEAECEMCGKIVMFEISKTNLIKYIETMKNCKNTSNVIICRECETIKKERDKETKRVKEEKKKEEDKKYQHERENAIDFNTKHFIENYLNPHRQWDGMNTKQRYSTIRDFGGKHSYCRYPFDENIIASFIKSMDYYDFLKTPYWIAISGKVKLDAKYKCKICHSDKNLNAHHPEYDIHGYEMQNIKDLVCLCGSCHSKFHDK